VRYNKYTVPTISTPPGIILTSQSALKQLADDGEDSVRSILEGWLVTIMPCRPHWFVLFL